jgi:valyl-tRNA synthetase
VTETIWESFNDDLLMVAKWPTAQIPSKIKENGIEQIQEIIIAIRNARSENKIEPAKKIEAIIYGHKTMPLINSYKEIIKNLKTGLSSLEIKESGDKIADAILVLVGEIEIYLISKIDANKEKERLVKEKMNLEKLIFSQEQKLNNEEFVSRAPEKIVTAEKEKLTNYQQELNKISNLINSL